MATFSCQHCHGDYDAKPSAGRLFCSSACYAAHVLAARADPTIQRGAGAWTVQEDRLLIDGCENGIGATDLHRNLPGRTLIATEQRLRLLRKWGMASRLDRQPRPAPAPREPKPSRQPDYTPAQRARVIELARTTGLSQAKIALQVGLSLHQARRIIDAMVPKRPKVEKPPAREPRRRGKTTVSVRPAVLRAEDDPLPVAVPGAYLSPSPEGQGCRYPMWAGRPGPNGFRPFCDTPKVTRNYCREHHAVCFTVRSSAPIIFAGVAGILSPRRAA